MINLTPILAASEFDVVIGIIFLLFWAVAAIAGKLKGKGTPQQQQEQQQPDPTAPPGETPFQRMQREIAEQLQQMHGEALRTSRPAPPPLPTTTRQVPPVARQMPTTARPVPPMRQQPMPQQPVRPPPRKQPKRQPPRPVQVFADVLPPPPPPRAAPAMSPAAARPATVTAPVIRRWLQPATLRQQFILTELFQPPMSMRQERF
jgi:hypothetical protein